MLEPKQSVETEETAGAELFVEGAEGGVPGMTYEIGGGSPVPGP